MDGGGDFEESPFPAAPPVRAATQEAPAAVPTAVVQTAIEPPALPQPPGFFHRFGAWEDYYAQIRRQEFNASLQEQHQEKQTAQALGLIHVAESTDAQADASERMGVEYLHLWSGLTKDIASAESELARIKSAFGSAADQDPDYQRKQAGIQSLYHDAALFRGLALGSLGSATKKRDMSGRISTLAGPLIGMAVASKAAQAQTGETTAAPADSEANQAPPAATAPAGQAAGSDPVVEQFFASTGWGQDPRVTHQPDGTILLQSPEDQKAFESDVNQYAITAAGNDKDLALAIAKHFLGKVRNQADLEKSGAMAARPAVAKLESEARASKLTKTQEVAVAGTYGKTEIQQVESLDFTAQKPAVVASYLDKVAKASAENEFIGQRENEALAPKLQDYLSGLLKSGGIFQSPGNATKFYVNPFMESGPELTRLSGSLQKLKVAIGAHAATPSLQMPPPDIAANMAVDKLLEFDAKELLGPAGWVSMDKQHAGVLNHLSGLLHGHARDDGKLSPYDSYAVKQALKGYDVSLLHERGATTGVLHKLLTTSNIPAMANGSSKQAFHSIIELLQAGDALEVKNYLGIK